MIRQDVAVVTREGMGGVTTYEGQDVAVVTREEMGGLTTYEGQDLAVVTREEMCGVASERVMMSENCVTTLEGQMGSL